MSLTYLHLVLAFSGAVVFVIIQLLLRTHRQPTPTGIETLVSGPQSKKDPSEQEYLVPLMVYEERYPAFGSILDLILTHFPLRRFLLQSDFERALYYLKEAVYGGATPDDLAAAMTLIVQTFVNDPDVEYRCREQLHPLVEEFLAELRPRPNERRIGVSTTGSKTTRG